MPDLIDVYRKRLEVLLEEARKERLGLMAAAVRPYGTAYARADARVLAYRKALSELDRTIEDPDLA